MNNLDELKTRNMMKFLGWLQTFSPEMHAMVIERVGEAPPNGALEISANALNGLGQDGYIPSLDVPLVGGDIPWWQTAIDAVKSVGTGVLQYKTQQDVIDLQMERIKQGKEPIDTALIAPTVRVRADLPPAIIADIRDMKRGTLVAMGAIALAVVGFLILKKR